MAMDKLQRFLYIIIDAFYCCDSARSIFVRFCIRTSFPSCRRSMDGYGLRSGWIDDAESRCGEEFG